MKNLFLKPISLFLVTATSFLGIHQGHAGELPAYYLEQEPVTNYLSQMPWHLYKSYYVPGLAWFWVDEAQDCVKGTIKQGKIWEPYIIDILKKYVKEGDRVVDVGAHMGTISLALSNLVGESGMVCAFESEIQLFRELYHNIYSNQRKNIVPYLCWLGNENKDVEDLFNPLSAYNPASSYSPVCKEPIPSWIRPYRTLDYFQLKNIALMKTDIECTEDAFLEGAKATIARCRPILVIEIMGGYGWSEDPDIKKRIQHTISILESMDYKVSKIWVDDYLALPKEREQELQ